MDREVFESLRDRLDAILAPGKFRLRQEVYTRGEFASMWVYWTRRSESVRLLWHGKDKVLSLQTSTGPGWDSLASGSPSEAETLLEAARSHVS